ncbi:hypothetical protein [Nitrosococcus wardiae]|uniref:Uncharacterized protein n=1 Tax=Nitrosococcus wardiae TaxID=1814290 RepID=A0A4P7BXN4_9GAMM|nr:hypothetical protein [Nitrosococcus wardiae]QBQ54077.1 hypothetical protein E3U44_05835 [Nitrosococcus wardiae]
MANVPFKDKDYDLVSTIYHASQGASICNQYATDADKEGDSEAAQFFKEVQEQNMRLVQKGKDLLKKRI